MATKVLIIEDDAMIQRMYTEIFKFENFDVATANDGEEGIAMATSSKPDVILCDVMMPKVSGIDVLRKLKGDASTKNIPIIMLSNLDDNASIKEALDLGAVKYLLKSAHDPKEITEIVQELIA